MKDTQTYKPNPLEMFVARQSNHIESDIERNWSSWNFGQEGFEGTEEELEEALEGVTDTSPFWISGFEIWPHNKDDFEFGELYENYWVAVDRVNAPNGLSAIELDAGNLEDAIEEALGRSDYWGEGICFDASKAELVKSVDDIHIFKIES